MYSDGLVFQPDSAFMDQYADLEGFDEGTIESSLEYRDSASWEPKSWVVGVVRNGREIAYDWNDLQRLDTIRDTIAREPILLVAQGRSGFVVYTEITDSLYTENVATGALELTVSHLKRPIPAYQEFWHSWRTFHPNTTKYEPKK